MMGGKVRYCPAGDAFMTGCDGRIGLGWNFGIRGGRWDTSNACAILSASVLDIDLTYSSHSLHGSPKYLFPASGLTCGIARMRSGWRDKLHLRTVGPGTFVLGVVLAQRTA